LPESSAEPVEGDTVFSGLECTIVDGVVLFARHNDVEGLVDSVAENNPGISPNDQKQGHVNNCYFGAALMALAESRWNVIADAMTPNGNGTFTVRLYDVSEPDAEKRWKSFEVDSDLARGMGGGLLSGDYVQSPGSPEDGYTEIWTFVAERAYAQLLSIQEGLSVPDEARGYLRLEQGGHASSVIEAFTGRTSQIRVSPEPAWTADDILSIIKAHRDSGKPVTIGSKQAFAGSGSQTIYANHAYFVVGIDTKDGQPVLKLLNPWGDRHAELRFEDFVRAIGFVELLEPLDP
jgi:hypothetical protein